MKEARDILEPLAGIIPAARREAPAILGKAGRSSFPVDLAKLMATRMLIQAASGGGKSYALRRLVEQTHGQVQQIIIDPEGELCTLADKFGFLVCSVDSPTAPLKVATAGALAETIYRSGQSVILSIDGFDIGEMQQFVAGFMASLMQQPKQFWHYCMVVVDEAQLFAPQQDKSASKKAMLDIAGRGRKRGLCPVIATQRLSQLHNGVAAHLDNKLIGLTTLDNDLARACEQLGMKPSKADQLRTMDSGEFLAYGPALSYSITKIKVGQVQTSHGVLGDFAASSAGPALTAQELTAAIGKLSATATKTPTVEEAIENMRKWVLAPLQQGRVRGEMYQRAASLGLVNTDVCRWVRDSRDGKSLKPERIGARMLEDLARLTPMMKGESA